MYTYCTMWVCSRLGISSCGIDCHEHSLAFWCSDSRGSGKSGEFKSSYQLTGLDRAAALNLSPSPAVALSGSEGEISLKVDQRCLSLGRTRTHHSCLQDAFVETQGSASLHLSCFLASAPASASAFTAGDGDDD